MSKLTSIAKDLLIINEDFEWRHRDEKHNLLNQDLFDLHIFEQLWSDTSCGFGGIAGQAFTSCNVYAFVPKNKENIYLVNAILPPLVIVYIGNRFAYAVPKTDLILNDIKNHNVQPVYSKEVYLQD
jgi:hypothetical protein